MVLEVSFRVENNVSISSSRPTPKKCLWRKYRTKQHWSLVEPSLVVIIWSLLRSVNSFFICRRFSGYFVAFRSFYLKHRNIIVMLWNLVNVLVFQTFVVFGIFYTFFGWYPCFWTLCVDVSEHSVFSIFVGRVSRKNNVDGICVHFQF